MKVRITAALVAVLAFIGIVLNASSASAAPGYLGPATCYARLSTGGYDNKSKMVVTSYPFNGGRQYHLAFYEDSSPSAGTNWNNFYIDGVLKASDAPDDNNPEERYVNMPTNVTHQLNAKWTKFAGGIPITVQYCYGTKPVM